MSLMTTEQRLTYHVPNKNTKLVIETEGTMMITSLPEELTSNQVDGLSSLLLDAMILLYAKNGFDLEEARILIGTKLMMMK